MANQCATSIDNVQNIRADLSRGTTLQEFFYITNTSRQIQSQFLNVKNWNGEIEINTAVPWIASN